MIGSLKGMTGLIEIDELITVGNGQKIKATKMGTMNGSVKLPGGSTHALSRGFSLGNDKEKIFIQKEKFEFMFDKQIETKTGYVVGTVNTPYDEGKELANPTISESSSVNINEFHKLLGHPLKSKMQFIAKYYGVKLTGILVVCLNCAQAKARQANITKKVPKKNKTEVPGERLHMDIKSIKASKILASCP